MHYAVPALLARAGMLVRLYTDICADVGFIRHLKPLWPERMRPKSVSRVLGRQLPQEVTPSLLRQVPVRALADRLLQGSAAARRLNGWLDPTHGMLNLVRKDGFAGANALYTLLINSDLDLVREAQSHGISVVHEAITPPHIGWLLHEERRSFLGEEDEAAADMIRTGNRRDVLKYQLADLILVPSDFVRRAVLHYGAEPGRVVTVPYGLDERWFNQAGSPFPGRVLFVGKVGIGKGSHYLAQATRVLKRRRVPCEVRVVGRYGPKLVSNRPFRVPTTSGRSRALA